MRLPANWPTRRAHAPAASLPSTSLHQKVDWAERETIRRALEASGGVKKDAAALMAAQPLESEPVA